MPITLKTVHLFRTFVFLYVTNIYVLQISNIPLNFKTCSCSFIEEKRESDALITNKKQNSMIKSSTQIKKTISNFIIQNKAPHFLTIQGSAQTIIYTKSYTTVVALASTGDSFSGILNSRFANKSANPEICFRRNNSSLSIPIFFIIH